MDWTGKTPAKCELCSQPFSDGHFIDGRTRYGYWAIMCCPCHYLNGIGFGIGRGQKYDLRMAVEIAGEFDIELAEL